MKNNQKFPAGLQIRFSSRDIEQMEEQSIYWDLRLKQFTPGKFNGEIYAYHTKNIQLSFSSRSTGCFARGSVPAGTTTISFPISNKYQSYYRGHPLEENQAWALLPGEEIEFLSLFPSSLFTIAISTDLLEKQAIAITGKSFNELRTQERLQMNPLGYENRTKYFFSVFRKLRQSPLKLEEWEEELIEKQIIEIILLGIDSHGEELKMTERLNAAKRAELYIRKNLKNTPAIPELCHTIGASERTLYLGFKERFGVSPKTFIKTVQLNGAHLDLLNNHSGKSISEIATKWEFFHLGRFSQQYHKLFGNLPSETQCR